MGPLGTKKLAGVLSLSLLLPAFTFAATTSVCKCGAPTALSYHWNFSREAAGLLDQVHTEAYDASSAAARLESFGFEPDTINWQAHASLLSQEKRVVNQMDTQFCRLRSIERVLPASQQTEINRLAPALIELTDSTQNAIQFLSQNEEDLWSRQYEQYAPAMYQEASRVEAATANADRYVAANYKWNAPSNSQTASHTGS